MKRLLLGLAMTALAFAPQSGSAADQTVVARGTASMTLLVGSTTITCSATVVMSFVQRGANFVLSENWGPGSGPAPGCIVDPPSAMDIATNLFPKVKQCIPNIAGVVSEPYTASVSGSTYTISATYVLCASPNQVDTITFTLGSPSIPYSHKFTQGTTTLISVSGNLTRQV
jgi:hypothetical protein